MDPKPQDDITKEPATQSTNPFPSDDSRYRALVARCKVAHDTAAQASPHAHASAQAKGKGRAEPPAPQQPQPTQSDDVMAEILLESMRWLRLNEDDKRTRLLFLPSDPDAFHLEHVGIPRGDL